MMRGWRTFLLVVLLAASGAAWAGRGRVAESRHNLSVSGPGPIKSTEETRVCIFCHGMHGTEHETPLWNRDLPEEHYTLYDSPRMDGAAPDGALGPADSSRLCLSCHDGTVALGALKHRKEPVEIQGAAGGRMPAHARGRLGRDLSGSHPVGIEVTPDLVERNNAKDRRLADVQRMKSDPDVHLDGRNRLQCTTCHDPHDDSRFATSGVHFYRKDRFSDTCLVCHEAEDMTGAKATSAGSDASGANPHADPNLLDRGCGACHRGHGRPGSPLLVAADAEACLGCHGGVRSEMAADVTPEGRGRLRSIRDDFEKPFSHPIGTADLHTAYETLPEVDPNLPRHVACVDCHDAHGPKRRKQRGHVTGPVASTLTDVAYEYELCYRCHSDSANLPPDSRNVGLEFDPGNRSYHPVEAAGRTREVPSLRAPWTGESFMGCTDCHGGDEPGNARSVHGSSHEGLLLEAFSTLDGEMESTAAYGLCYRCHSRISILRNDSFARHREHLTGPEAQTSCRTCHNPHGSRDHAHLLDFNPAVVAPTALGELRHVELGPKTGECYLTCHGVEHAPARYCPAEAGCPPGDVRPAGLGVSGAGLEGLPPVRGTTPRMP